MRNLKDRVVSILFALGMATLPMLWPQTISKAQLPVSRTENISSKIVDSLNEEKSRVLDSALQVASSLPKMSTTLSKYIRKNSKPEVVERYLKPQVVLRYNGEVFEVDAEYYKGYLIVDCDELLPFNSISIGTIDTLKIEPAPQKKRSWLQRLFHKQ